MLVRDLMSHEVVTLNVTDSLDLADDVMRLGRIRHMPVVAGESLVGILSQRDLFRAALSSALHLRPSLEREWLKKIPVEEVMTKAVLTANAETPVRAAVALMIEKRIGCLPVIDGGKLVGLLSESDCLRYLAALLDRSTQKDPSPEAPP